MSDALLLGGDDLARMLARLSLSDVSADAPGLARVQRAWMLTQPFHNLDLLADFARGRPPLDRRSGWERCLHGLGGPCHVQASSFLALVQSLGFDAHFASATITHPNDHLVVAVHLAGGPVICDVGNGHPYIAPFPLIGKTQQSHLGWRVRTIGDGKTVLVEQRTPGQTDWRRVYRACADERQWRDFEQAIGRHHREPGFGPFLTGLRATRIGPDQGYTLRDDTLTHHTAAGMRQTQVSDHARVLVEHMDLGGLPVEQAVRVWRHETGRV